MKLFYTLFLLLAVGASAQAATFTVNINTDTQDAVPGNGLCADALGLCSLRAAISEANALAGDDTITLPAGTYTQTLIAAAEDANAGGDYDITGNLTINGLTSTQTIVQAAPVAGTATERVFHVTSLTAIVGLTNMTVENGRLTGATSATTRGGGIRNQGILGLGNVVVRNNQASGAGGIRNEGTLGLAGSMVTGNLCSSATGSCFGGGIYSSSFAQNLTITDSEIRNNNSTSTFTNGFGFAAGIGAEGGGTINLTRVFISTNVGTGNGTGGGNGNALRILSSLAAFTFTANTLQISNNSATGGTSTGGAVFLVPSAFALTTTFTNSTISANTGATTDGAGFNLGAGTGTNTLTITNSTISGNSTSGFGGGIEVTNASSVVNINNSTIASNTAGTGGGIDVLAGTVNVRSTIVGDNTATTASPDINGAVVSGGYNLFESVAGATVTGTTTSNIVGQDPQLDPLFQYGGLTQQHRIRVSSPAIDKGNSFGTTTDQRGLPRPVNLPDTYYPNAAGGDAADIGAFEVQLATAASVTATGKVMMSTGKALSRVVVTLTDSQGNMRTATTNREGYFTFTDLQAGETYIFEVRSKIYRFNSQVVTVTENLDNVNFTAQP